MQTWEVGEGQGVMLKGNQERIERLDSESGGGGDAMGPLGKSNVVALHKVIAIVKSL